MIKCILYCGFTGVLGDIDHTCFRQQLAGRHLPGSVQVVSFGTEAVERRLGLLVLHILALAGVAQHGLASAGLHRAVHIFPGIS